jgi:hypothetical protein
MSDPDVDDDIPPEPDGEIVHWMAPKPLAIGPVGLSGAVAGAFVLGAVTAVGVLALMHMLAPPPREAGFARGRKFDA